MSIEDDPCIATGGFGDLLGALAADPEQLEGDERVALIGRLQRLRGWLDAREAALLAVAYRRNDDVNSGARDLTQLCQQQAGVGYGDAKRRAKRAEHLPGLPAAGRALSDGQLGTGQTDELVALADRAAPAVRDALAANEGRLVGELGEMTPTEARKHLAKFETDASGDDGVALLDTQRSRNKLRISSGADGTRTINGSLDPVSAAYLNTCLDHHITSQWRTEATDREGRQPPAEIVGNDRRRAEALIDLVRAGHSTQLGATGVAEIVVHIDYKTLLADLSAAAIHDKLGSNPTSLAGLRGARLAAGDPIPASVARRLACDARIIPAVLDGESQPLDVGRSQRTATAAQRRALAATHTTCAISVCDVAFDYCQIHHITWWRQGGTTNLANLTPLCAKHHHLIHDHNWQLQPEPGQQSTLTRRADRSVRREARPPDRSERAVRVPNPSGPPRHRTLAAP